MVRALQRGGRLWESLYAATADQVRAALDALLVVPPGGRVSELERWRTGPARPSGPQMVKALHRVAEIIGSGLSRVELDASRRLQARRRSSRRPPPVLSGASRRAGGRSSRSRRA